MSNDDLPKTVDTLLADAVLQQAQVEVLLELFAKLAKLHGIEQIDGLSVYDWFHERKKQWVSARLIALENTAPAVAAHLQKVIDDAEDRLRERGEDV